VQALTALGAVSLTVTRQTFASALCSIIEHLSDRRRGHAER
jgi:hypothetical protein